jgi:Delta7-sterol 5-desaturase
VGLLFIFILTLRTDMKLFDSIANTAKDFILLLNKYSEIITLAWIEYFLAAGLFYMFFYVWKREKYWPAKIQQRYAENKQTLRDIAYSFSTTIIFGIAFLLVLWASKHGHTLIYPSINKYGYTWYFLSIVIMVIVHDAYFYWTHRLMHWKAIFKWVHKVHHLSHNPTSLTSYSFHPTEAIIHAGIIPLIAFTIPAHVSAISIFFIYQLVMNIMGHVGYDLYPKNFTNNWHTKLYTTPTHHNMHHQYVKFNFGLYLSFWDWVMKTNHPKYEEHFEVLTERRKKGAVVLDDAIEQQNNNMSESDREAMVDIPNNQIFYK